MKFDKDHIAMLAGLVDEDDAEDMRFEQANKTGERLDEDVKEFSEHVTVMHEYLYRKFLENGYTDCIIFMSHSTPGKVGFISLGCAKATVDSERILTELRVQGYEMSAQYDSADLVIVNTCGFIDAAIEESLEAIGEALNENGKVIVTGCLGAKGDIVKQSFPDVLAVTGSLRAISPPLSAILPTK